MVHPTLSLHGFAAFLAEHQENVYAARSPCTCPLAAYLLSLYEMQGMPLSSIHVGDTYYVINGTVDEWLELPAWAWSFVTTLDANAYEVLTSAQARAAAAEGLFYESDPDDPTSVPYTGTQALAFLAPILANAVAS
jgi:hypothetical protein